jgi:uncharacterized protein YkwD
VQTVISLTLMFRRICYSLLVLTTPLFGATSASALQFQGTLQSSVTGLPFAGVQINATTATGPQNVSTNQNGQFTISTGAANADWSFQYDLNPHSSCPTGLNSATNVAVAGAETNGVYKATYLPAAEHTEISERERVYIERLNAARRAVNSNLPAYVTTPRLAQVAAVQVTTLASYPDRMNEAWAHLGAYCETLTQRFSEAGITGSVSELRAALVDASDIDASVNRLMGSAGHRAILLDPKYAFAGPAYLNGQMVVALSDSNSVVGDNIVSSPDVFSQPGDDLGPTATPLAPAELAIDEPESVKSGKTLTLYGTAPSLPTVTLAYAKNDLITPISPVFGANFSWTAAVKPLQNGTVSVAVNGVVVTTNVTVRAWWPKKPKRVGSSVRGTVAPAGARVKLEIYRKGRVVKTTTVTSGKNKGSFSIRATPRKGDRLFVSTSRKKSKLSFQGIEPQRVR